MLVEIHGQKRKSLCLGLLPIFLLLSPLFSLHYIQPLNKKPASFQCHWWALTKNKRIPISFISTLSIHQPVDLLQKHWNRYYIPMANIWNTELYAAEQCVITMYLWNTDFHSLCNFACNQYHTWTKSDDFLELSKIHVELKLVGYTKMERIHVLIKRNIIEKKIKDISTDWDSSAISWLYWDD